MTAREESIVRDLRARLRIAEEKISTATTAYTNEVARLERRLFYAERNRKATQTRLRKALDAGRHWHGRYLMLERRS